MDSKKLFKGIKAVIYACILVFTSLHVFNLINSVNVYADSALIATQPDSSNDYTVSVSSEYASTATYSWCKQEESWTSLDSNFTYNGGAVPSSITATYTSGVYEITIGYSGSEYPQIRFKSSATLSGYSSTGGYYYVTALAGEYKIGSPQPFSINTLEEHTLNNNPISGGNLAKAPEITEKGNYVCIVTANSGTVSQVSDVISPKKISFSLNGGSGTAPTAIYQLAGRTITLPIAPSRTNYTFLGWDVNSSYTSASYSGDSEYTVSTDKTLFAIWRLKGTISFNTQTQIHDYTGESFPFEIQASEGIPTTGYNIQYYVDGAWTTSAPIKVGNYNVKISRAEDDYFKAYSEKIIPNAITINKGQAEITVDQTPIIITYGASVVLPVASTNLGDVICDTLASSLVLPNSYTVTYSVAETSNYYGDEKTVTVLIKKILVSAPIVLGTYTYTGNPQTVSLSGVESYMSTSSSLTETNAGNYTLVFTLDSLHDWDSPSGGNVVWTIGKADAEITVDQTTITKEYGESFTLPIATSTFGTPTCDKTLADLKNAGTYTVTYTVANTSNYNGDSKSLTVEITTKVVKTPKIVGTYKYSGSAQTVNLSGYDSNYMSATDSLTETDADTYTITFTLDANHVWDLGEDGIINWTIDKGDAEISVDLTPISKGFGESFTLPTATSNFGTVTCDKTLADLVNVGTYIVTYEVASTSNYNGDSKQLSVEIVIAKVTTPQVSGTYTYTGNPQTVSLTGVESYMTTTSSLTETDANTYTITFTLDTNHTWDDGNTGEVNWVINKADAEITVNTTTITKKFGESFTLPIATTNFGIVTCDKTLADLVNVGTYTVTYEVAGTSNYNGDSKILTVEIETAKVTTPQISGTYTYTGNPQTVSLTGVESFMTTTDSLTETDANTYTITFNLDSNHEWEVGNDGIVSWIIEKADAVINVNQSTITKKYGESITLPTATSNFGTPTCDTLASSLVALGSYTVTYEVLGTSNYNGDTKQLTVVIEKADYDMSGITFSDASYPYDGASHSLAITGTLPATLTVSYSANNSLTYAGSVTVAATFINSDSNYNDPSNMTATLEITKATNLVTLASASVTFTYGDSVVYPIATALFGTPTPDKLEATLINANTYQVKFSVAETSDYEAADATLTVIINKANYVLEGITFNDDEFTYDETAHSIYITGTLPEGVTVSYSNNSRTNAGSQTATASFNAGPNYNDPASMNATITVVKATNSVTLSSTSLSLVYGDSVTYPTATATFGTATPDIASSALINVGTYTVTFSVADTLNYYGASATLSVEITKATNEITLGQSSITVKFGETITYPSATALFGTPTPDIMSSNLTSAGTHTVTFSVTETLNYDGADATLTVIIEQDVLDMSGISFDDMFVIYDGTAHSLAITGTLPAGVTVNYSANNNLTDVGVETITASFIVSSNYETPTPLTATLKVIKAQNQITLSETSLKVKYNEAITYPTATSKFGTPTQDISLVLPASVGTYYVHYSVKETANYYYASATYTIEIEKADYDLSGITFADFETTYDGNTYSLSYTGTLPTDLTASYSANNSLTNAGIENVVLSFINSNPNYNDPDSMSANLKINKASNAITLDSYSITSVYGEIISYPNAIALFGTPVPDKTSNSLVNVGTYTVKFSVDETTNYDKAEAFLTVEIEKAYYDMSNVIFNDDTVLEDDHIHYLEALGLPGGLSVSYDNNYQSAPGIYEVTAKFTGDSNHYPVSDMLATLTINYKIIETKEMISSLPTATVEKSDGFSPIITVEVEVTLEENVKNAISTSTINADYYNLNTSFKLRDNESVGAVYTIKLYQTVNGVKTEIKASDLPNNKLKVKVILPEELDVSKITKILHVEEDGSVHYIAYKQKQINDDGYYEIDNVKELVEFAFIYKLDGNTTNWWIWLWIFLGILLLIYIIGYFASYRQGYLDDAPLKCIYFFLPRGKKNRRRIIYM